MSTIQTIVRHRTGKLHRMATGKGYYLGYLPNRKILFFRVHKCASTTLARAFSQLDPDYYEGSAANYRPRNYVDWIKVAWIRDPVERIMSLYRDKVATWSPWLDAVAGRNAKHLVGNPETFVWWVVWHADPAKMDPHIRPQRLLVDAPRVDFWGRVDRMALSWLELGRRLGGGQAPVGWMGALGHYNSTDAATSRWRLPDIEPYIRDFYKSDYELIRKHC